MEALLEKLILPIVTACFSGLFIFIIQILIKCWERASRKKNLVLSLTSEIKLNIEFATHNSGCADRLISGNSKTKNFIKYENTNTRYLLSSSNFHLSQKLRDLLTQYVVTTEHVNSIMGEFINTGNNGIELIDYSITRSDSIEQISTTLLRLIQEKFNL